ncbi:MAG: hypothetical protein HY525_04790 [Betaproteobacteria bacterium]|nr:hypothetical protein [Betaproteobacteria bacterium]
MLFLVITTPRRDSPSSVTSRRQEYWKWIDPLLKSKEVRWVYARVGRGGVALFDVDSTLKLHEYINEWSEYMPAHFDVYPLLDSDEAQAYLKVHARKHSTTGSTAAASPKKRGRRT